MPILMLPVCCGRYLSRVGRTTGSFTTFFFNDTAPTEIYTPLYTLSLHDALPIFALIPSLAHWYQAAPFALAFVLGLLQAQRSEEHTSVLQSHSGISYAVFCLKKKKKKNRKEKYKCMNEEKKKKKKKKK